MGGAQWGGGQQWGLRGADGAGGAEMGAGGRIGVGATDGAGGSEGTGGGGGALGGQKGAAPLPPFVARRPGGSRSAANGAQRGPALPSVAPFIRFARSSVPSPVHRSVHSVSSPFGDAAAVAAAPPKRGHTRGTGHCGAKSRGWGGGVKCGADLGWVWGGVEASLQELSAAGAAAVRTGGDGEERGEAGGNREPRAARSGENREHREFYWEETERSGGGGRGAAGAPGGERGAEAGGSGRAERGALGAAER